MQFVMSRCWLAVGIVWALWYPAAASAQGVRYPPELRGFDFRKDGAWRPLARLVRQRRALLLSQSAFGALNAPLAAAAPVPASAAVTGVFKVPAVLFKFKDTNTFPFGAAQYDSVLFGATPPSGRPYTYRSYYRQMSTGLLDIQGQSYGPAQLDSNEVYYTGDTSALCRSQNPFNSTNCDGIFSNAALARMQAGLAEALRKVNLTVDFSPYADTSGFVPMVVFLQPALGGECGPRSAPENHFWSHRYFLQTTFVTTNPDPNHPGQNVKISDYILEPGVGGASSCNVTEIMPIGTVAHETGHGFGLPDLYDTGFATEGVGEYSLMGAGNYSSPFSPSRMDAWSLSQLGWVTLVPLGTSGAYTFGAGATSDTVFVVRPTGANTRGESFLFENRQAVQSDSAMLRIHCQVWYRASSPPASCGGGLLVWHVDSTQLAQHGINGDNRVNAGAIHGLALLQADGFGNLDWNPNGRCTGSPVAGCSNRGDAGDLYPGPTGNRALGSTTQPNDLLNTGLCSGLRVDSVSQVVPNGSMRLVLGLGRADSLVITTAAQLVGGQWGYAYGLTLGVSCGTGSVGWVVDSGATPPGLTLTNAGLLSGAPTDTGTYTFRTTVTSGVSTARRAFTLRVSEPALTLQQVLALAFQGQGTTTDDQHRYLDLQGNANGTFDLGDVLRWLERTGNVAATPTLLRMGKQGLKP
jgi:M6 family metalloprotease-like protein